MTVNQDTIESIVRHLTEGHKKRVEELHEAYRSVVIAIYVEQIPDIVSEAYAKHPEYFNDERYISYEGHGFSRYGVYLPNDISVPQINKSHGDIHMTGAIASRIKKAKSAWEKADKEYETLQKDTRNALKSLRTTKRIAEAFPQSVSLLPLEKYPAPAVQVNVESLKKRLALHAQPEVSNI